MCCHNREAGFYLQKVRPLVYKTMLQLVQENVALGQSVGVTTRFEQELDDATYLHSNPQMSATIIVVKVTVDSPIRLTRFIKHNDPRDKGKRSNRMPRSKRSRGYVLRGIQRILRS